MRKKKSKHVAPVKILNAKLKYTARGPPKDAHPAVYDHHVKRVSIEPALHGLTNGADLVQRWSVHVRPACIQGLKAHQCKHNPELATNRGGY